VREYVWRHSVRRHGHLLHDEGRVADNGLVYSRQWLTLPGETGRTLHDHSVRSDVLVTAYFKYIRLRFRGLVQVGQQGESTRISLLGLLLLCLTAKALAPDQVRRCVAYTITGGLLVVPGASGGQLIVCLHRVSEGESRLMVEVSDYQARLLRFGPANLLYRLSQAQVHRWITFGYLVWCIEQGLQGCRNGVYP
jgi:hypothetical protein